MAAFAHAAPAGAATEPEATAAAAVVTQAQAVPTGWTGNAQTCTAGTESQESLDATVRAANGFRQVAGLAPVSLAADPDLNRRALVAATLMRANNDLSHQPPNTWSCWTQEGASAASTSNLALAASGAGAIRLYVDDEGVSSLGHRRWVLNPAATAFASGSTPNTNALTVLGMPTVPVAANTQVPWPPAGALPPAWLPTTWSISVGGTGQPVDLGAAQVTMSLDGQPVAAGAPTDLGTGYGTGRTLAWSPALNRSALRTGSHRIDVVITGVTSQGVPIPISYTTTLGPILPPTPLPTPAPTPVVVPDPTPVATPVPLPGLRPRITHPRGKVRLGTRLTASLMQGTGRISTRIQWTRGGEPIKGATAVRYKVARRDLGRTLRVQVSSQAKDGSNRMTELSSGLKVKR
ncbi:MAG: CAP domain-containing protein [Patulibacter minatonensis]